MIADDPQDKPLISEDAVRSFIEASTQGLSESELGHLSVELPPNWWEEDEDNATP